MSHEVLRILLPGTALLLGWFIIWLYRKIKAEIASNEAERKAYMRRLEMAAHNRRLEAQALADAAACDRANKVWPADEMSTYEKVQAERILREASRPFKQAKPRRPFKKD